MRFNKKYAFAVQFAHTSSTMGIKPYDLAKLCKWADERAGYYALWNNADCKHAERYQRWEKGAMDQIESLATAYGYATEWPGLYPSFIRLADKREFTLPG